MKNKDNLLLYHLHYSTWEDYEEEIISASAQERFRENWGDGRFLSKKTACVKSDVLGCGLFRKDLFFSIDIRKKKSGGKNPES